jgi:hypothetical protein
VSARVDANCEGACEPGFFCPPASVTSRGQLYSEKLLDDGGGAPGKFARRCQAGSFGGVGQTTAACSGQCSAGYWCAEGSTNPQQFKCGCPAAADAAQVVDGGVGTCSGAGDPGATPNSRYCPKGTSVSIPVPAGQYSAGGSADGMTRTLVLVLGVVK